MALIQVKQSNAVIYIPFTAIISIGAYEGDAFKTSLSLSDGTNFQIDHSIEQFLVLYNAAEKEEANQRLQFFTRVTTEFLSLYGQFAEAQSLEADAKLKHFMKTMVSAASPEGEKKDDNPV